MNTKSRNIGLAALTVSVLAGTGVAVGASQSNAAPGTVHTASSSLTVRSGPSTGSAKVGTLRKGAKVNITCQTKGSRVNGTYGSSVWWDKIGAGRYVSDAYVYTGSDNRVAPLCGTKTPPAPAQGNRAWGDVTDHNTGAAGQCTYGAYAKFKAYSGVYPLIGGNAKDMAANARAHHWTVTYAPQANSMVVFQPGVHGANRTYGHVAWVKAVHGNTIDIVEMNWPNKWTYTTRTVTDVSGMQYILAPKKR
ncbi:CHAP domain-containing protein [Calidifontibacter terrae]